MYCSIEIDEVSRNDIFIAHSSSVSVFGFYRLITIQCQTQSSAWLWQIGTTWMELSFRWSAGIQLFACDETYHFDDLLLPQASRKMQLFWLICKRKPIFSKHSQGKRQKSTRNDEVYGASLIKNFHINHKPVYFRQYHFGLWKLPRYHPDIRALHITLVYWL